MNRFEGSPSEDHEFVEAQKQGLAVVENIQKVVLGKPRPVKLTVGALFAKGHVLIEDVPGVAKTVLARALAASIGGSHGRIQGTPDLTPSDIIGTMIPHKRPPSPEEVVEEARRYAEAFKIGLPEGVFSEKEIYEMAITVASSREITEFLFKKGSLLLSNVLLVDEGNRATPKTQAATLEAMAERQVTYLGETYQTQRPLFVIYTQNPLEQQGVFPLPEAQLDRFLAKFSVGYPDTETEEEILKMQLRGHPLETLDSVVSIEQIRKIQDMVQRVDVSDEIKSWIVHLVARTRTLTQGEKPLLQFGASPRGSLALLRLSRAIAFLDGEDHVQDRHVREIIVPVLGHRIKPESGEMLRKFSGINREVVLEEFFRTNVLDSVPYDPDGRIRRALP